MQASEPAANRFLAVVMSRGALAVGYGVALFGLEYLAWACLIEADPRPVDGLEVATALLALHVVWWWLVVRSLPHRCLPALCIYLVVVVVTGCLRGGPQP